MRRIASSSEITFSSRTYLPNTRALVPYFFFQAEDGIRDLTVTGVQTCALPILFFVKHHDICSKPRLKQTTFMQLKLLCGQGGHAADRFFE